MNLKTSCVGEHMTLARDLAEHRGAAHSHVRCADAVRRTLQRVSAAIRAQGSDQSALIVHYSGHADADRLHLGA